MISAARKLGVTAVPLNYRLSDEEATYVTDHCDATIVYVDAEFASMFERIRAAVPKVEHVLVFDGATPTGMLSADELMAAASDEEPVVPRASRPATMIYTSGTTGKPKGALRPNVVDPSQVAAMIGLIGYTPDDVYLPTNPLYHSGPLELGGAQALGQTVDIAAWFDRRMAAPRPDAPSQFHVRGADADPDDLQPARRGEGEVRHVVDEAHDRERGAVGFALKQMYLADFPSDSLWEVYGSTELGVNCILKPEDQLRKPGSCGQRLRSSRSSCSTTTATR